MTVRTSQKKSFTSAKVVVAAAAASVIIPMLSAPAFGQFASTNRGFFVSNGNNRVEVRDTSATGLGSLQYTIAIPGTGFKSAIAHDHAVTGAFFASEGSNVRIFFDTGVTDGAQVGFWTARDGAGNPINTIREMVWTNNAVATGELWVSSDQNLIYVYRPTDGTLLRTVSPDAKATNVQGLYIDWYSAPERVSFASINNQTGSPAFGRIVISNGVRDSAQMFENNWNTSSGSNQNGMAFQYNPASGWYHRWGQNTSNPEVANGGSAPGSSSISGGWAPSSQGGAPVWDGAMTNSGFWMVSQNGQVMMMNNASSSPSFVDRFTISDPKGVFYKGNNEQTQSGVSPWVFPGLVAGLNDITISSAANTGVPASDTVDIVTTANNANQTLTGTNSIVSKLNGSAASTRVVSGSAGGTGNGDTTLSTAFDYNSVTSGRTLELRGARNVAINGAITDGTPASVSNLNLVLAARSASFSGTAPTTGGVSINETINLTGGSLTSTSGAGPTVINGAVTANGGISLTAGTFTFTAGSLTASAATTGNINITATDAAAGNVVLAIPITAGGTGAGNLNITVPTGRTIALTSTASVTGLVNLNATGGTTINLPSGTFAPRGITMAAGSPLAIASPVTVTTGGLTYVSGTTNSIAANVTATGGNIVMNGSTLDVNAGVVTAPTVNLGGGSLAVNGGSVVTTGTSNALGTSGTVTVNPGGTLSLANLYVSLPTVSVVGGTLNLGSGTVLAGTNVNFSTGTVGFTGNVLQGGSVQTRILGTSLGLGKTVNISGQFNVNSAPYSITGGTLNVGSLSGPLLALTSGTLGLTDQNLQVGGSGGGFNAGPTLSVGTGQTYSLADTAGGTRTGTLTVAANGVANLTGGIITTSTGVVNNGTVNFTNEDSRIIVNVPDATGVAGAGFLNNKLVKGTGRIDVTVPATGSDANTVFTNAALGEIRVDAGNEMVITSTLSNGDFGTVNNLGRINVVGAANGSNFADLQLDALVFNDEGGRINGQNANVRFANPATSFGLVNAGQSVFSGTTNVYGSIQLLGPAATSTTNGRTIVAAGATVYFNDDVQIGEAGDPNNARAFLTLEGGSVAQFFGNVSGRLDNITGPGTAIFSAGSELSPGFSPGYADFEGNLTLGGGSTLFIELAGLDRGVSYDAVDADGTLSVTGSTLKVGFYGGYTPELGDQFNVLNAGNLVGSFGNLLLPGGPDLWIVSRTGTSLSLTFIPEPSGLLLAAAGTAMLGLRRRSRRA